MLKLVFFQRLPPLLPAEHMADLEQVEHSCFSIFEPFDDFEFEENARFGTDRAFLFKFLSHLKILIF